VLLRWLLADEEDREDIASQALKRREGGDALAEHIGHTDDAAGPA
jgi:hypothetical protein